MRVLKPLICLVCILGMLLVSCMSEAVFAADNAKPSAVCTTCAFEPEALALEKLLTQYKALADNGGWPQWQTGKTIKLHQKDARITTLRQILTITGDYAAGPQPLPKQDAGRLNNALADGVKHFQARHGLNPDGALGKSTQEALAVSIEGRIRQIEETISRIRSRAQPGEAKFILVNLPAFTLYGIKNGKPEITMRVIIGSPKNPTPLFDNEITDVIFNPQWHVPPRIATREMAPKLLKDPAYFVRAGFVVTQDGQPVDPLHFTPDGGKLGFRQRAGNENALGKIKFNLPDSDDIYLHSTSTPKLFAKDERALSHGCVRVEHPQDLAYFTFEDKADWGVKRIDAAYESSRERWVKVNALPVHLVYWTALVDGAGTAHFYKDVYGIDDDGQEADATDESKPAAITVADSSR